MAESAGSSLTSSSSRPGVQSTLPFAAKPTSSKIRKSYTREEKLKIIAYYRDNNKNCYKTCKFFNINFKNLYRWVKEEDKIKDSKRGRIRRRVKFERRAEYPEMEQELYSEFMELRKKGLKIKVWWFRSRAKQLLDATHPDHSFKFSEGWFTRFKTRFKISLRRPTNKAQQPPDEKEVAVHDFHQKIRKIQSGGIGDGPKEERFTLSQIANMDQTLLPFSFTDGPTYDTTNASTVWVRGAGSGLDKRQCTVQLTIFADGEDRVKPMVIFRGTGKRISLREKVLYDKRVSVVFQVLLLIFLPPPSSYP